MKRKIIGEQTIYFSFWGIGGYPQQAKMYHEVVPFALLAINSNTL
ncbi:hypothetical protein [Enterococcus dispar]|nr:hypothetical protein [Enterococcus dispar]MDT2706916.1 hypothetical protein [Enterococcus dispar]